MILLTSFFESKELEIKKFSAAVYQPQGFNYPKVQWADIRNQAGTWIRPRNFTNATNIGSLDPLKQYRAALYNQYHERLKLIQYWLSVYQHEDVVLCCWCPHDKAAKRQLDQFGSYICHLSVIYEFLRDLKCDVQLHADRERMFKLWELN